MSIFIKAVVDGLKEVVQINARIDGNDLIVNHFYDIGVAVGSERGLVVPVIRDCDKKSFAEIEKDGQPTDDKVAVPVQRKTGWAQRGVNLQSVNKGCNQGQFCIKGEKPKPVLKNWTRIPGGLKQVTASGKGWVWGVNSANQI